MPCAMLLAVGCSSHGSGTAASSGNIMKYSRNILIEDKDDCHLVKIRNPWDTTKTLASYCLVPKEGEMPLEWQGNTELKLVQTPLKDAVVYSNIYVSLLRELGHPDMIKGVCDAAYITDSLIAKKVEGGEVMDCGLSTAPNIEKILSLNPEAIILSPMDNTNGHGKLDNLGITLIEGAEYTEATPLARAEWMRFFGRLIGEGIKADSLFATVEQEYNAIKEKAKEAQNRPVILFDGVYGNQWNVPTSGSVTGALIEDAGGRNPFSDYSEAGSAHLSPEEVVYKAATADFWFVRYYSPNDYSLSDWISLNKSYSRFKAIDHNRVYGSNTSKSSIFDDGAFHPQWILADMVAILHPELNIPTSKRYYRQLK